MVYVDNFLCINGTNKYTSSTSNNVAQFGDTSDSSGYYSNSLWDNIRFNTSGNFKPKHLSEGILTSVEIILPNGYKWDELLIDKTELTDTYINITLIDGTSGNPIPGFENLKEEVIDISSIDSNLHPSIKLVGNFIGTKEETPILHCWALNYTISGLCAPASNFHARLSPGAPANIELFWNASSDDGGGNDNVTGYTVYKSISSLNGDYEFAAWVPANGSLTYNWTDEGAGDGDWSDYFYLVRANDTSDKEEQNNNIVGKFVNYLVEDWNLISVPLVQYNTSMKCVLQTIEGNYVKVQGYHAGKSRPWLGWHRDKPHYFNNIIEIDHKYGYYIDMLSSDHLVVAGRVPVSTQITLKTGWNLVGYPSVTIRTVEEALSSISGKYNRVEFYNTTTGKEEPLDPEDLMYPGYGYWIHVKTDCVWQVPM
ncbi:MAG: hypothetical protein JSW28_05540 [Thermoplasmata archaeon]|nr:MAG: hypothetical protein JSW28_05540 [Thermoplasmata archaeon]